MDIYETTYLITVVTEVGGQQFMDVLAVVFAIIMTGYFAGPRMTRPMIWGLTLISAWFVIPMIVVVHATLLRIASLAQSLPMEQAGQLPYLNNFGVMANTWGAWILPGSLAAAFIAAIYFVFHCHKKGTVTAAA